MKVLIVNENLKLGGAESISVELANALVEKKIEVYFVSSIGPLVKRLKANIDFFEIPKFHMLSIRKIIHALSKIISKIKPDIIHSQGATLATLVGISTHKVHSNSFKILTHHNKKFTRIPHFLATFLLNKYCDHIIAISQSKYNKLQRIGIFHNKISLIPNFIDCNQINSQINSLNKNLIRQELNISKNNYVITMIGRLIPFKRFDKFIKILAQFSTKSKKEVVGLIIGDGLEQKKLENLAHYYSDKVKIFFLGYQSDIYKYLSISDIFLFPSEHEVLPMVLIEASATGVPIVCSNILGNNDIVKDGQNGFLISDSEEEYANCILKILNDNDLALKMSNNGIKVVRNEFDKKKVVNKIISLYNMGMQA